MTPMDGCIYCVATLSMPIMSNVDIVWGYGLSLIDTRLLAIHNWNTKLTLHLHYAKRVE